AAVDSGESISTLAGQFISLYGRNGIVYGHNVTEFLASISMNSNLLSGVTSVMECPSQSQSIESLIWTRDNATHLVSTLLGGVQTPDCYIQQLVAADDMWGYGLLFVTLINLCAVLGIIFLPFMGRRFFKLLMTFMVSLAVGSLMGTALLILLPDCLQLAFMHEEVNKANSSLIDDDRQLHLFHAENSGHTAWKDFLSQHPWYLWRCCAVFGGIYMFFIIERMLKELIRKKHSSCTTEIIDTMEFLNVQKPEQSGGIGHGRSHSLPAAAPTGDSSSLANFKTAEICFTPQESADQDRSKAPSSPTGELAANGAAIVLPIEAIENGDACYSQTDMVNSNRDVSTWLAKVQPVAWMILLGDALHNFIDGLSIGAAFTRSTLSGVSICLAVLCEELPHELGDFAILLSAGMSMPMALLCNFLSACTCYLGFALGVWLGETGASVWIFAVASGMFLYISLVDM
uniref:Solute carrier family 39 (Zinc transporter), member 14 n=1 Tax=Macrostomum lignano TaxID=282301 RepID=A0A1I8I022_9PLAT